MTKVSPPARRNVVEILNGREQPVDRRDVDDRAPPFPRHGATDCLAAEERTLDVDVHHRVERRLRVVLERPDLLGGRVGRRVESRVVHEHVRDAPLRLARARPDSSTASRSVTSTSYARTPSAPPSATSKLATASRARRARVDPPELAQRAGDDRDLPSRSNSDPSRRCLGLPTTRRRRALARSRSRRVATARARAAPPRARRRRTTGNPTISRQPASLTSFPRYAVSSS